MKIFCFVFIIMFQLFFSDPAKCEEEFNGHTWLKMPKAIKTIFIEGYLNGYNVGFSWGKAAGADKAMEILDNIEQADKTLEETKECKEIFKKKKEKADMQLALTAAASVKRSNIARLDMGDYGDYYVNEVDAFLQTFPLCKRQNMYDLLLQLVIVWLKEGTVEKKFSYSDIGKLCLEGEK